MLQFVLANYVVANVVLHFLCVGEFVLLTLCQTNHTQGFPLMGWWGKFWQNELISTEIDILQKALDVYTKHFLKYQFCQFEK